MVEIHDQCRYQSSLGGTESLVRGFSPLGRCPSPDAAAHEGGCRAREEACRRSCHSRAGRQDLMLQDVDAKRKTEVEIFAGRVVSLVEQCGIATPVNRAILHIVKVMEQRYLQAGHCNSCQHYLCESHSSTETATIIMTIRISTAVMAGEIISGIGFAITGTAFSGSRGLRFPHYPTLLCSSFLNQCMATRWT